MTETIVQGADWLAWVEQFKPPEKSRTLAADAPQSPDSKREAWDQTDRALQFSSRQQAPELVPRASGSLRERGNSVRAQWLEEHDVHTQFLDAGIGCCWFAQQGDEEPVCGETEDAAIARLSREKDLPWDDALSAENQIEHHGLRPPKARTSKLNQR